MSRERESVERTDHGRRSPTPDVPWDVSAENLARDVGRFCKRLEDEADTLTDQEREKVAATMEIALVHLDRILQRGIDAGYVEAPEGWVRPPAAGDEHE